jgi:hypothetical protein
MAYFRGDHYIFDTGDHVHFWIHGERYDAWREWAERFKEPDRVAGVQVPANVIDRFVLMRVVEMLVEGTAVPTLDALASEFAAEGGNTGHTQLMGNLPVVRSAFAELTRQVKEVRPEDLPWWPGMTDRQR